MSDNYFNPEENEDMMDLFDDFKTREIAPEEVVPEEVASGQAAEEGSYEWNSEPVTGRERGGEYHYSYINGNNSAAPHNPNNYDDAFSSSAAEYNERNPYSSDYAGQPEERTRVYNYGEEHRSASPKRQKKTPKSVSRGFVAAALAVAIVGGTGAGFMGGMLAGKQSGTQPTTSDSLTIKQVSSNDGSSSGITPGSTSEIVKKTANSVVEIKVSKVSTDFIGRQYSSGGAGSGVIISEDGYIITNYHVIEGSSNINVTLRDGTTEYPAKVVGSDEDNDIALIKIEASGLSAATFGDSSDLVVGDYVVAIGNPLGTLGGTVTDGIISALAREVTIEGKNLTLLQTNAQISPGNSGGGLFNANGELVGIVNAKDSATEVEGIAFAIPINNVVGIIRDLKDYGYVTGKIDTGMSFVDVKSNDAAFYYNVNELGVYILSVNQGSNAEQAGFARGYMVTAVNGVSVSSEAEIEKALENNKVGDSVTFTVKDRSGETMNLKLELSEYVPTVKPGSEDTQQDFRSNDSIWDQLLNW